MVGQNKKVYLVIGLSGSGKSFVCSQVAPYSYRIKFDRLRGGNRRQEALKQASQQDKPIVADITKLVSTTIKLNPEFVYKVVFIDESLEVVRQRIELRGGTYNEEAVLKRQKRLRSLALRHQAFSGSSDECLQWLKHELRLGSGIPEPAQFYVYGIYELNPKELRYIGKGHRNPESGYDRVDHYDQRYLLEHRKQGVVFDRLNELISRGIDYCIEIIEDGLTEYAAFERERTLIRAHGLTGLWNRTDGGSVGWTLSEETRRKMSESRKGKKYGPRPQAWKDNLAKAARRRADSLEWRLSHSARLVGKSLSAEHRKAISSACKGNGRPKGWELTRDESEFLGVKEGKVELNSGQKSCLRRYRYAKLK